ncbi:hypothetical protein NQZ68_016593 [Dissostichus eleginoides]|nr:hypothetical protein NQZ68_016593 [Dissostichus eleginoides]
MDVCEVSEERREKETGPFLPDKMMQVFVKGGGSPALLQLLSLAPASGPAIVCVWKAGSIRAQPSQPHSACLLCVPPPQPPACYAKGPG